MAATGMSGPARTAAGAAVAAPEPRSAPVRTSAVEIVRNFTVFSRREVEVTGAADPRTNMPERPRAAPGAFGWWSSPLPD
ncbi:hypothetical protein GCM10018963_39820 [Saccharothrix longispora]